MDRKDNEYKVGWSSTCPFVKIKVLMNDRIVIFHMETTVDTFRDEEWHSLMQTVQDYYNHADCNGIEFRIIFDVRSMESVPISHGLQWIELFQKNRHITEKCVICTSMITSNKLVRDGVNFFLKFYSPIKPFKIFTDSKDAKEFCESYV